MGVVFERTSFEEFPLKNVGFLQKWNIFGAAQERQVKLWERWARMWRRTRSALWSRPRMSSRTTSRKSSWVFALILIYFSIFVEKYGASCILHPLFLFSHLPSLLSPQSGCVECRKPEVRNKDESRQTSHFTWKLVKRMNNFEERQIISIFGYFQQAEGGSTPNRHFDRDGPQGKRLAKIS